MVPHFYPIGNSIGHGKNGTCPNLPKLRGKNKTSLKAIFSQ